MADFTATVTLGVAGLTETAASALIATHNSDATSVHGIADTSVLTTRSDIAQLPRVWPDFAAHGTGVRLSRSGTTYQMWQRLAGETWARWTLASESGLPGGGNLVRRLTGATSTTSGAEIVSPVLYVQEGDGSIAYSGTGWATITNANASGGTYSRPTTSGAKATWTTPAGTTRVGLHFVGAANNGIAKVTIDGSATAANLLPTAQQLVDAGAPNTILVANGGPFSPTDRVLDFYRATTTYGQQQWLADDLAAGVHTVVIEMTAAKQSAATDSRITIDAFWYGTPATTPDTASVVIVPFAAMNHAAATTEEYAVLANAGGSDTWIGGTHGYEVEGTLTFEVDGASSAPADGATVTGSRLKASRTTTLYHPAVGGGSTAVATTTVTYEVDDTGLRCSGSVTWAQSLNITRAHIGMLTANGSLLRKFNTPTLAAPLTLSANDGSFSSGGRSLSAWLWDPGDTNAGPGRAAALVVVSSETVNNWANSDGATSTPRNMAVEDRTSGTALAHKVYPTRVAPSSGATVASGTVWTFGFRHRFQWFPTAIAEARCA